MPRKPPMYISQTHGRRHSRKRPKRKYTIASARCDLIIHTTLLAHKTSIAVSSMVASLANHLVAHLSSPEGIGRVTQIAATQLRTAPHAINLLRIPTESRNTWRYLQVTRFYVLIRSSLRLPMTMFWSYLYLKRHQSSVMMRLNSLSAFAL